MSAEITFGAFIREKRLAKDITLRRMADLINISPVYMSRFETGRRAAPKEDILQRISQVLLLNKQDQEQMYELAAKSKTFTAVPGDLPEYISENELARIALRVAKDVDATDTEWTEFIEKLRKRSEEGKQE